MGQIINNLLILSRLNLDLRFSTENVDMNEMVKEILESFKSDNKSAHHKIESQTLLSANCNQGLMQHVWTNIISNALKFSNSKSNPLIKIDCHESESDVIYSVSDNGVGFDMQKADKIFVPFERLHNDQEFDGTGIGLAIVQRIILNHYGKVWVESKVGEGTSFYFSLPKADRL